MPTIIDGSGSADFQTPLPIAEGGTGSSNGTASININGTIGASTASTGSFTTLSSTTGANFATSSGNVGIGTSSPVGLLQVNGLASNVDVLRLTNAVDGALQQEVGIGFGPSGPTNTNPSAAIRALEFDTSDFRSSLLFYTRSLNSDSAPIERMRIDSAGNVGIATTSPTNKLQIVGTAKASSQLYVGSDSDDNYSGGIKNLSNSSRSIGIEVDPTNAGANSLLVFNIDGTEHMRLNSAGKVGIGTTNPASLLDVNGDALISGLTVGKGAGAIASNTAIGTSALNLKTTGSNNTATGQSALRNNTTGAGNTALNPLNSAGSSSPVFNPTTENNRFCMGSTGVTNAYIQVAWTVVSDARDKTNFAPVPHGLEFVKALQPTAYQFRTSRDSEETNGGVRYGFKAQNVLALEGANPVIVDNEDADKLRMIDSHMIPILVKAIQELSAEVDNLKQQLGALK